VSIWEAAITIGAVVVGALLAFLGALWGTWKEAQREHARWLRERRHQAYEKFMAVMEKWATRAVIPGPQPFREPDPEFYDEMTAAESAVDLVGPQEVIAAMQPMRYAILKMYLGPEESKFTQTAYHAKQQAFVSVARAQMVVKPTKRERGQ
jgi:hypothetical protein